MEVVVAPAQGDGKACPEVLTEDLRECSKDCPAGAPNSTAGQNAEAGEEGGEEADSADGTDDNGRQGKGASETATEKPAAPVVVVTSPAPFCSIEEEVWTDCSTDCLQERYMGADCEKEAEVRCALN